MRKTYRVQKSFINDSLGRLPKDDAEAFQIQGLGATLVHVTNTDSTFADALYIVDSKDNAVLLDFVSKSALEWNIKEKRLTKQTLQSYLTKAKDKDNSFVATTARNILKEQF